MVEILDLHCTSERIHGGRVNELKRLLELRVVIHEHLCHILSTNESLQCTMIAHREHRTENLVNHGHGIRVLSENDRRLHEETSRVVRYAKMSEYL